ncbi:uncharacterized protein KY384_007236 [Bacidia gigantensis]|uniref:uncharacterized protein n=1 Tax=Bacidia gigantensis TaxID=2732470 RepID=UPI001D05906D|nr:uncharacterized protein KY384_007236 [Bacidia gigantensis]KAG8528319.1 hypothetical protein KY384_007236 [Bacidia gigantensis]
MNFWMAASSSEGHGDVFSWLIDSFGSDLRESEYNEKVSPFHETPTTLALYSSRAFAKWQGTLSAADIDFSSFVIPEVCRDPIREAGWTSESLLAVFETQHEPDSKSLNDRCCADCWIEFDWSTNYEVLVQPLWLQMLSSLYLGQDPHYRYSVPSATCANVAGVEGILKDAPWSTDKPSYLPDLPGVYIPSETDLCDSFTSTNSGDKQSHSSQHARCEKLVQKNYSWEDLICIKCWLHYKKEGKRFVRSDLANNVTGRETSGFVLVDDNASEEG